MIVRNAVNESLRPAVPETKIMFGGPDVGAQKHTAAQGAEHDCLGAITAFDHCFGSSRQPIQQDLAEEFAIVG